MVTQGPSLFVRRSNCEPTQLPWESISGLSHSGSSVDTHLFNQVLRPSGTGRLGPFCLSLPEREPSEVSS
jgi:hypothetical protein